MIGQRQTGYFGRPLCPDTRKQQNFDKNRYFGKWYEGLRDSRIVFEKGECVTAEYTLNDKVAGQINVHNSE